MEGDVDVITKIVINCGEDDDGIDIDRTKPNIPLPAGLINECRINNNTNNNYIMNNNNNQPPPYNNYNQGIPMQNIGGQNVYVQGYQPQNAARQPALQSPQIYVDEDFINDQIFGNTFHSRKIRHKFIKKVYLILTMQMLYSLGCIALCMFEPHVHAFVRSDFIVLICAGIAYLIIFLVLICVKRVRRSVPYNYILLSLMTIFLAYVLGAISAMYTTFIVLSAMGATAGVCIIITVIACQHWFDMTAWGMYLCIGGMIVSMFGTIALIVGLVLRMRILFLVYSGIAALLFSIYLMYDTQLIIGGKNHKYQLSPEEYIAGAICLYTDIVHLYMALLPLIGACR